MRKAQAPWWAYLASAIVVIIVIIVLIALYTKIKGGGLETVSAVGESLSKLWGK